VGTDDPDPGAIIVPESRSKVRANYVFLAVLFAGVGATGFAVRSGSFKVGWGIGLGIVVVLLIAWCLWALRHPARLEVTEEAVRYFRRNGRQAAVLPRQYGDEVVFVVKQNWRGQQVSLAQRGLTTTAVIPMTSLRGLFSRNEVRQAVLARGWRFKSGS